MTETRKPQVLRALRWLLRPIFRILLGAGVTWKEAAEVCKLTLVEVASRDFGLHGRPTNVSRVAIMTGLGRREVSRLRRELEAEEPIALEAMNAATRVLTGWHLDRDFQTADGKPRDLDSDDETAGFVALCHRYAGDVAAVTMQRELQRAGALELRSGGQLRVLQRYYMPSPLDPEAVIRAGSVISDLGSTVAFNLSRKPEAATRFEGRASNMHMRLVDTEEFRAFLELEGQAFLERTDAWLSEHEASDSAKARYRTTRMGVGVYQIHDDQEWDSNEANEANEQ